MSFFEIIDFLFLFGEIAIYHFFIKNAEQQRQA
jgi:hypothetical protein